LFRSSLTGRVEPGALGLVARGLLAGVAGTAVFAAAYRIEHRLRPRHADPLDYDVIEQVQFITGKRVEVHLASHDAMSKAITQLEDNQFDEALKEIKSDPSIKPHRDAPYPSGSCG